MTRGWTVFQGVLDCMGEASFVYKAAWASYTWSAAAFQFYTLLNTVHHVFFRTLIVLELIMRGGAVLIVACNLLHVGATKYSREM